MAITEIASHIQLNDENSTPSLIPPQLLNLWREEIGEEIWHFNQVTGDDVPQSSCSSYVQSERDVIARGMYTAYQKMTRVLGYTPLPQWFVQDIPLGFGSPVAWQQLQTTMKHVIAYGQRATTVIEAAATVTYSKSNTALAQNDTATITVASEVADGEIQIFFTATDSGRAAADERYRISPVTVTTDGANKVITGHRALFVDPDIWDFPFTPASSTDINNADTSDAGDFVTTIDIYRVFNDTTTPVQFMTDPITFRRTDLDDYSLATGVVLPVNNRLGMFNVRLETCPSNFRPRSVRVHYQAGYREQYQRMENELAQALMRLANVQMVDMPTLCNPIFSTYTRDIALVSQDAADNPFGMLKGDVYAWNIVRERAIGRGGKLTSNRVRGALW